MKYKLLILIAFGFLFSVRFLFAQEFKKPEMYSTLSIDSNRVLLVTDEVVFKESSYTGGGFERVYNHHSNTFHYEYNPGHYSGITTSTVKYHSFIYGYNKARNYGILLKNIEPYLSVYEPSRNEFLLAKKKSKNKLIANSFGAAGIAVLCVTAVNLLRGVDNMENTSELMINYVGPAVLYGGSYYISKHIRKKESEHLERAVDLYNEELINEFNLKFRQDEELPEEDKDIQNKENNPRNEKSPSNEAIHKLK
jgi:hypothetical protein